MIIRTFFYAFSGVRKCGEIVVTFRTDGILGFFRKWEEGKASKEIENLRSSWKESRMIFVLQLTLPFVRFFFFPLL